MAYTPMFFRLSLGYTEVNYNGFWETLTYGLFALYKSDWTKFGGFNTVKYTTKWGEEDWDILDRYVSMYTVIKLVEVCSYLYLITPLLVDMWYYH